MSPWPLVHLIAFIGATGYALYLFGYVIYSRAAFIRLGRPGPSLTDWSIRLRQWTANVLGHRTLRKDRRSGWMHMALFYGFIIVQFGAVDLIGQGLRPGWHLPLGSMYPYFTLMQELTVVLILAAVGYAFYRRYIEKLPRLKRTWKAGIVLIFIASLMLTVLLSEAFQLHSQGAGRTVWQPVSSLLAAGLAWLPASVGVIGFYVCWWLHLLILLSFLVYVPQSKHAHLLFAPVNLLLRKISPPGRLAPIDFEDDSAEEYGVGRMEHFRRDQLMDLYACVECGRCTNVCPASSTGKLLSPMHLIVKLRDHLTDKGSAVTSLSPWVPAFAFPADEGKDEPVEEPVRLTGGIITEQELWACTTCRNCEDQCPVGNEHVDMIIDMRRFLVMTEGSVPAEAQRTLNNLERQGNPWGLNRNDRDRWMEGLGDVGVEPGDAEYLLYVGSMGSYDARSMKITQAMVRIMNQAGIRFAVLGNEERNSGDTARRLGNEYLFQQLAAETVELFERHGVRRIVTIDPHAYNTFKHEYPDFGLSPDIEIYHHTELIARWIREGRIRPSKPVRERITYHDSCYLGRYNEVYEEPRDILKAVPGLELVEMERSRSDSMCCGAGGGLMWLEEREGKRVNVARTDQALAVTPTMIGTACPYCLTMMSDGLAAREADDRVRAMDVAEIVAMSLE
jgi:Fe-S oxidoreductase